MNLNPKLIGGRFIFHDGDREPTAASGREGWTEGERMSDHNPTAGEAAVRAHLIQRDMGTRVTCWFCHTCGRYIGPGEKWCDHEDESPVMGRISYSGTIGIDVTDDASAEATADELERIARAIRSGAWKKATRHS